MQKRDKNNRFSALSEAGKEDLILTHSSSFTENRRVGKKDKTKPNSKGEKAKELVQGKGQVTDNPLTAKNPKDTGISSKIGVHTSMTTNPKCDSSMLSPSKEESQDASDKEKTTRTNSHHQLRGGGVSKETLHTPTPDKTTAVDTIKAMVDNNTYT
jgi:hypothetical protein